MKKLLASSALALVLAASGPAMAQDAPKQGGEMIVTYKDDVSTLDPAIGYDWQNWSIIKSLFDGLMDYKPGTMELVPDLAESYEIAPDGLTYTFKLRPGVKFHNGRALVAEDIKGSIARIAGLLADDGVNIATLRLTRKERGGDAFMVIEVDEEPGPEVRDHIRTLPWVKWAYRLDKVGA